MAHSYERVVYKSRNEKLINFVSVPLQAVYSNLWIFCHSSKAYI